ncbi:5'-nucleotidase, lipoprotein e(P4) family [Ectobacillus sp. sgz5001026]|uniref:5'-nucleotidase, lipoprotein e(P4) family n=1 Tax=Ectobacillus sp. sgz5001026 TaxID=3242473 RepID=UPI0036D38B68
MHNVFLKVNLFIIMLLACTNVGAAAETSSVLWYQTSGEARALYYQGFQLGKMKLLEAIRDKPKEQKKPLAVVLDLDETVFDNSPFLAKAILTETKAYLLWNDWVRQAKATALPGSIDFLTYADGKGINIYYVSNRNIAYMDATLENLKRIGAPQATKEHVLLQVNEKGKEARRQFLAAKHTITLYFGDNINDFLALDGESVAKRNEAVDQNRMKFGQNFIIFPNPMYGDWEQALYNYEMKTEEEKQKLQQSYLRPY